MPWAAWAGMLPHSKIALITTGGVHLVDQKPFGVVDAMGDASYRIIPAGTARERITITHAYYDHADADADLNIVFPLELLVRLGKQGVIGPPVDSYGFMGHITGAQVDTLIRRSVPEVVERLKEQDVDGVLLTPA
ncbi:MAG: glycine/sarcosine/betaine reductase selenoprotein B family protein [Herpetosiphon sp.]